MSIRTDRSQILIGERIAYELLITIPSQGYSINFALPDSVPHFEVIGQADFDTISTNGNIAIHQKIIFTSFDSGAWYIPALPVTLKMNNKAQRFITDSVLINVDYAPADTTAALRDIKPIMLVDVKDYFWLYVIGIALSFIILGLLAYNYFKMKSRKLLPVLHSNTSPYDEAMAALKELAAFDLTTGPSLKQYHTTLGFILKRYFSRITEINLLNKTTGDLLVNLKEQQVETGLLTSVAATLRIADAVKFAKYLPPVSESEQSLEVIKNTIQKTEKLKQSKN